MLLNLQDYPTNTTCLLLFGGDDLRLRDSAVDLYFHLAPCFHRTYIHAIQIRTCDNFIIEREV